MLEALLLVGGQGTRLRPLTLTTPKPMLPVAGVPFLAHQIAILRDAGVSHIVLATSYKPEIFTEYFGDGSRFGVELDYVHETEPLGTGGAIRNGAAGLRGAAEAPVIVLNGDVLSGHDLAGQVAQHRRSDVDVTLHLVEVPDARAYGCVPTDERGNVTEFLEKMPNPVTRWVNAGAYVFRRSVIDSIPVGRVVSVERETFPQLLEQGRSIGSWKQTSYWIDVGTPAALVQCSADLVRGVVASSAVPGPVGEAFVATGADVDRSAQLTGGSSVGINAKIAADSRVHASIVMMGVTISRRVTLDRSIVGRDSCVHEGCVLVEVVVGDGAVIETGAIVAPGSRIVPGSVVASPAGKG